MYDKDKKIVSLYKEKCNQLEGEITVLKTAISELSQIPNGINVGLDKQVSALQNNIQKSQDPNEIKKNVELLIAAMSQIQKKKQDPSFYQENHAPLMQKEVPINKEVNLRLNQLINHLLIPDLLKKPLEELKASLAEELTTESLSKVIDKLTDLVMNAFNLEHNQFKRFLKKFAGYPQVVNEYLLLSKKTNLFNQKETFLLEKKLGEQINIIQDQLKNPTSIKAISSGVNLQLDKMTTQINLFREKEIRRMKNHEEKIKLLQEKLSETESNVEQIRHQLASHKIKINQDPLTELPNRAAFEETLLQGFHRWQRGFGEMTLVLIDLDHFKEINERYGYQSGDYLLKEMASLFRSSLRSVDFVARYGGEEFVFLLEHTPINDAWKLLEDLRIVIEEKEFRFQEKKITMTASFGLTSIQHGDTVETLFIRAEKAIYRAKQDGRNKVICHLP